jgi:hypothetical protein
MTTDARIDAAARAMDPFGWDMEHWLAKHHGDTRTPDQRREDFRDDLRAQARAALDAAAQVGAPEGVVRRLTETEARAIIERIETEFRAIRWFHDDAEVCCSGCREDRFAEAHGRTADAIAAYSEYTTMRYLTDAS